MTTEQKKRQLERYNLQLAKIKRFKEMSNKNSDRTEFYKNEICSATLLRNKIEDAVQSLSSELEREILAQKYFCGKSFDEIAALLNYSKRQVERLHIKGIEHIRLG